MLQEVGMGTSMPSNVAPLREAGLDASHMLINSVPPPHVGVQDDLLYTMVEDLLAHETISDWRDDCPSIKATK